MSSGKPEDASSPQGSAGLKFKPGTEAAKVDLSLPSEKGERPEIPPLKTFEEPEAPAAETPAAASAPAHEDIKIGPLTTGLLVLIVVAFVCWAGWLFMRGDEVPDAKRPVVAKPLHIALSEGGEFKPDPLMIRFVVLRTKTVAPVVPDAQKLDVNKASREELMKIPGMNEWIASAVVKRRPYKTLDDLVNKSVIGETRFEDTKAYLKVAASK